jgi:flagella basal body P-ring formation protein FlgA
MHGFAKTVRMVAVLAVFACATQLLWLQFSYGDTPDTNETSEKFAPPSDDGSVPRSSRFLSGAILELRSEATIEGADVKLKQICRWSAADQEAFAPIADLVVARLNPNTAFRAMTQDDLKSTLSDAGVNLAVIRFCGAMHCTVSRSDITTDEQAALQGWVNAKLAVGPATQPAAEATLVSSPSTPPAPDVNLLAQSYHTLRERLIADLSERLSLDPNCLQMHFSPGDEKLLGLSEPLFQFNLEGLRADNIGQVSWQVTIFAAGAKASSQQTTIAAVARVWQEQWMVRRPMAYHQTIRGDDLVSRRILVKQLDGERLMKREQLVGQLCSRELQAGTVLTARLVDAAPLAKTGDLVTVTLSQGNVKITTVMRAIDGGSFGQSIRGKQETTGAIFDVTLTGPQCGAISPEPSMQTASANVIRLEDPAATWITASAIAQVINQSESSDGKEMLATAIDPEPLQVSIPRPRRLSGDVQISPVVVSHEGLTITTIAPPSPPALHSPPVQTNGAIPIDTTGNGGAKLQDLVNALNQLKVPAADRIAIIKELYKNGKLRAKLITE